MAESVAYTLIADRSVRYSEIQPQIEALIADESDLVANLANIAAVLKEVFGFFWVGFYLAKDGELVLGPFQGPLACTRIAFDRGVCGHAFSTETAIVVPNVDEFPGHIACASASRSEVVVPMFDSTGKVAGVLDVDSDRLDDFSDVDVVGLSAIVAPLSKLI
jgi:GAF domain-containing protein